MEMKRWEGWKLREEVYFFENGVRVSEVFKNVKKS